MGSRIFERKLFFLISRCAAAKWSWRLEPSSLNYSSRYLDSNGFFFLQFNPFKLGFRWVVGEIEKRLAIPRAWRHPICDSVFKAGWLCLDALFFCCRMPPSPSVRCCVDAIGYHPEIQLSEYYLSSTSFNPLLPLRKGKRKKNICIFWIIHHIAPYRFPRSGFLVPSGHPCSNQDGEGLFQLQSPLYVFQFRIRYWASSLLPPSSFSISTMDSRLLSCLLSTRRIKAIGGMWPKEREKKEKEKKSDFVLMSLFVWNQQRSGWQTASSAYPRKEREKYMEVECERSVHHQQEFEIEDADVIKVNHSHSRRCPWTRSLL